MGLFSRSKKVKPDGGADGGASTDESKKDEKTSDDKKDEKKDDANAEIGPEHGPRELRKRGCTDCCCVLLFLLFFLGMFYITYLALVYGEPYQILYGKDYLGNRCGRGDYADRRKVVYPRLDQDLLEQSAIATTTPWRLQFYGICVEQCPNVTDPNVCMANPEVCMVRDYGTPEQYGPAGGSAYYFQVLPTIDLVNRCVPTRAVDSSTAPDRCAYPQCDNATYAPCDTEHPRLWMIRGFSDRLRCEVRFQHVEVSQFATMTPSPLTARIADQMAFLQRLLTAMCVCGTLTHSHAHAYSSNTPPSHAAMCPLPLSLSLSL